MVKSLKPEERISLLNLQNNPEARCAGCWLEWVVHTVVTNRGTDCFGMDGCSGKLPSPDDVQQAWGKLWGSGGWLLDADGEGTVGCHGCCA